MSSIGVKLELNGAATFSQGMKNATSQVRLFDTQIKGLSQSITSNASAFTRHQKTTEALKGKLSALKTEQGLLNEKLAEAKAKYGENSTQANNYANKLEVVNQKINATESALNKQGGTLGAVGAQFGAMGAKLDAISSKIQTFGTKLTTYVTLPLVALGTKGATSFAEVDKTMQLTNSTMGNTTKEARLLSDAMKTAASNSTYGMSDAATATLNFARAGLNAKQSADALAPAMNLAAGEGGELDIVSAGLVATINGFAGSFSEASNYADIFANACNNSALDVNSLSESMSIAAPIFSSAGYSVKDAALYMGVMANAGIDANTAATALKTGMARLVSPTKDAETWLNRLGISVTNADGTMKDSLTVQSELHNAFSTLSESEQLAAASAIFGKNQMSNWLALVNTAPSEVDALSRALETEGTTMEMASAMMSGFGGSMEKLKSSLDVAVTSLGEALAPTISIVADKIQELVDWFNSLDAEQQTMIATVLTVVAAVGPLILVIGKIGSGISSLFTLLSVILPVIGSVLVAIAPFLPMIIAITGAIAAIIAIIKNWGAICEFFKNLWTTFTTTIKTTFENVKNSLISAVSNIKEKFTSAFSSIKDKVTSIFKDLLGTAITWGKDMIDNFINGIKQKVEAVKNAAKGVAQTVKDILGFSEPKKGPLSNFHTYGPDMMKSYAKGIDDYSYLVKDAVTGVAADVSGLTNTTNVGGVKMNIYGAQGQDVNELALIIEDKLNASINRREVVFA